MNSDEHIDNPCNRERYYKFIDDIMDENVCKGKSDSERIKDYARKLNNDYNTLDHKRLVDISRCLNNGIGNVRQLFEFLATSIIATFALFISVMTLLVDMFNNDISCVCSQTVDFSLQNSNCLEFVLIAIFLIFIVIASALYIRHCYKRINKYEQIGLNTVYFEVAALLEDDKEKESVSEPEDNENV